MPEQLFVFIQLEFPWALGPADGRYLVRVDEQGDPQHVVVLGTLGAARQQAGAATAMVPGGSLLARLGGRSRTTATGSEPAPVPTTRVTVIDPVSLAAENQARAWLAELDHEREVMAAVAVVNRMIRSHRLASADPYVHEVAPAQALVIRAGWGEGEQVADGRWLHARALPWQAQAQGRARARPGARRDRSAALRPQERMAALLGARTVALLCEELTLRARADLDHGRTALAALELDRALELALQELREEGRQDLAIRIAELEQLRSGVQAQAQAAVPNGAGAPNAEVITHALERLEAALRARTAAGLD